MYAYSLAPIDVWAGWVKQETFKSEIGIVFQGEDVSGALADYESRLEEAKGLAEKLGWEGDIKEGPYIAALPSEKGGSYLIAWKQDNKDATFLFSPFELPWLKAKSVHSK
jgi:hypothetical protein